MSQSFNPCWLMRVAAPSPVGPAPTIRTDTWKETSVSNFQLAVRVSQRSSEVALTWRAAQLLQMHRRFIAFRALPLVWVASGELQACHEHLARRQRNARGLYRDSSKARQGWRVYLLRSHCLGGLLITQFGVGKRSQILCMYSKKLTEDWSKNNIPRIKFLVRTMDRSQCVAFTGEMRSSPKRQISQTSFLPINHKFVSETP